MCVVLFASGNGDENLQAEPIGPDELPAMPETLAVGGCDTTGAVAVYSDFGPYLSVVAPTWSGISGDPRIVTIDPVGNDGYNKDGSYFAPDVELGEIYTGEAEPDPAGHYTGHFTGTSAATPLAAGVAALVLSVNPELSWREVFNILQSTAEKVGADAPGDLQARYDADGHDPRYGYGRVHAARAVAVAKYGRDQVDGAPCWMDLNCLGVCVPDPAGGGGPMCLTPCVDPEVCGAKRACVDGYCDVAAIVPDDVVIRGSCGCGATQGLPGGAWGLLAVAGSLLAMRRSRARILPSSNGRLLTGAVETITFEKGATREGRGGCVVLDITPDALKRLSEYAKARDLEGPFRVVMSYG